MEDTKAITDTKPFANKCMYQRFDDQKHGFMTSRGDFAEPYILEAVEKAIGLFDSFFSACMASPEA